MRMVLLLAGLGLATACAPVEHAPVPAAPPPGRIELHQDARIPADIDAAFRSGIVARYIGDVGLETTAADLTANGFICHDLGAYPAVQPGGVLTVCELPKPHGLCTDMWTVDLRLKRVTRQISFHRVAAEGRFARTCVSGASPDG